MKNKIITLLMLIVSLFMITGCKAKKEEKLKIELQGALDALELSDSVSNSIYLPNEVNGYQITWNSNNENIISIDGVVNPALEDVEVTLIATISKDSVSLSKEFKVTVIGNDPTKVIEDAFTNIIIPNTTDVNIDLPAQINNLNITWSTSDKNVISNRGIVKQGAEDVEVILKATINYEGITKSKEFVVTVLANPVYKEIDNLLSELVIPLETYENINLPTTFNGLSITWKTSRSTYLTAEGVVNRSAEDQLILLTAVINYNNIKIEKYYDVTVKGWTDAEKLTKVLESLTFNETLSYDLILSTKLGYDSVAIWQSSNQDVLTNEGVYTYDENVKTVTLTVIVKLGSEEMQKEFDFSLKPKEENLKEHLVIERAEELNTSKFNNVELVENKLVLKAGASIGTYESGAIETKEFTSLVASWAAISSTTATVELQVKVRVGSVWSDYISYKEWGLGLQNACYDQSNSLIKLSTDEVMVQNGKRGNAIMYKVTLRTTQNTTPELSLVCFALEIPGHTHQVDISSYPRSVIHDVPKLYQQVVPTIGNSICSATSSTMLLKYKGESFTEFDAEYEHRYMASIVRDYGNKIYGNWVYNTVAMSGYGYDAYVARFYSINELVEHLATVGPCALSVKGQMTSDQKNYYTNGHLIVAIGYEILDNGQIVIVCNDPNVSVVTCRYSLTVMNNTWRNIAYVIE